MHRGARALRSGAGPLVGLAPGGAHPHRMKHALQVDVGRSVPPCDNILSEPNWARASERSGDINLRCDFRFGVLGGSIH